MTAPPLPRALSLPILAAVLVASSGCQIGYVMSQGWRQLTLQRVQVPLDSEELQDELTEDERSKLAWVPRVLEYCRDELGLDPGDSYTTLLDTGGEPVSHVVVASHALALVPYRWHFPIAGDVPYKGYFDPADAEAEAERLDAAGYDTDVIAVGAYSTLGWFRDPVLSTSLELELPDLVDLLIHETTHRTFYFEGDTDLNEALATHFASEGTLGFLAQHPELAPLADGYRQRRRARIELEDVLLRLRDDLERLYASPLADEQKLARKDELFGTARLALRQLDSKVRVNALPASNALVIAISHYRDLVPRFAELQSRAGGRPVDLASYLEEFAASGHPTSVLRQDEEGALSKPAWTAAPDAETPR